MTSARLGRWADTLVVMGEGRRFLLALVAGAATALALPPLFLWPVLFVSLPLLVFLVEGAQGRRGGTLWPAFRVGWAFGFGYHMAGLWWIGAAFLVDAEEFLALLPVAVTLLPAGLALFCGTASAVARFFFAGGWTRVLALAAALSATEWLRGHVLSGFPWNAFGALAATSDATIGWVALWGVYGLALPALAVFMTPALFARGHGRRGDTLFAGFALLAVVGHAAWLLGREPLPNGGSVAVRVVQPAVPQRDKWDPENAAAIVQSLLDLSGARTSPETPGLEPGTLLVWPESVFPFLVAREPSVLAAIADLVPDGAALVSGGMRGEDASLNADGTANPSLVWNSVLAFDPEGRIVAAQDKTHLVPFGEYLPFQDTLESFGLRQLTQRRGGFEPGAERVALDLSSLVAGLPPVLALVCYEIVFPGDVVPDDAARPGMILNVTNDGWFGRTTGPHQHAHAARLRGVEEGLPLVRAANDGVSFVADAHGAIVASLGRGQRGTLDARLPLAAVLTPYARWRDLPLAVALALCVLVLGVSRRDRSAPR